MLNLCVLCTFSTFAHKVFKGWDCNFTWSFGKVMHIKSLKLVFVARIIIAFCDFLFKNHFRPKIIFILLRSIWLPGVYCILVLFKCVCSTLLVFKRFTSETFFAKSLRNISHRIIARIPFPKGGLEFPKIEWKGGFKNFCRKGGFI